MSLCLLQKVIVETQVLKFFWVFGGIDDALIHNVTRTIRRASIAFQLFWMHSLYTALLHRLPFQCSFIHMARQFSLEMKSACPCSTTWGSFDVRFLRLLILVLRGPPPCPSAFLFIFFSFSFFFFKVKNIFLSNVPSVGELFSSKTCALSAHGWDMSVCDYNPTQYFKLSIFNKDSRVVFLDLLSILSWHLLVNWCHHGHISGLIQKRPIFCSGDYEAPT